MEGGKLHDGAPKTLIDYGLISEAFSNRDIHFDQQQKRFILRDEAQTPKPDTTEVLKY